MRSEPAVPATNVQDGTSWQALDEAANPVHEVPNDHPGEGISRPSLVIDVAECLCSHRSATII